MSDNNSGNRKKSDFPAVTSVPAGSFVDVFSNGINQKITYDNFLAGLGVTGTLAQAGNVLATPVLDKQGTVNNIRNIEDGSGIKSSISPQNGLTLAHNFNVDTVGAPLMLNPTLANPTFPSLLGSSSIAVVQDGNQIRFEATTAPVSTKTVIINQVSDFPTAVSGVITLASNTDYFITNDITTSSRFVFGDSTQFRAAGTVIITLTYTGTGAMITCQDCDIRLREITLAFPNGSLFNITSSTAAGIGIVATQNTVLIGGALGNVSCRILSIFLSGVVLTSGGLVLTASTMDVLSIDADTWIQFAGKGITLGTTVCESIQTKNIFLTISSGVTFLDGLANSGNITATGEGLVADVRGTGLGVELGANINPDDDRWAFAANSRIRNTIRDSILSMHGNTTDTVIGTAGIANAVKVAGTFIVGRESGFSGDTTGASTYDLVTGIVSPMTCTIRVEKASGGATIVGAAFAVDGVVDVNSQMTCECSSSDPNNIFLTWQEELSQGQVVTVVCFNESGTINNTVTDMILRIQ
jgi:hypothetical protein